MKSSINAGEMLLKHDERISYLGGAGLVSTELSISTRTIEEKRRAILGVRPIEGLALTRRYSSLVDSILLQIATAAGVDMLPDAALMATGGYGRYELAPESDIDVAILVADEDDPAVAGSVKCLFHLLTETFTDQLGLRLGYSYRRMDDIAGLDFQTQTALLDARLLAGSDDLVREFGRELRKSLDAGFILRHVRTRQWESSPLYVIEPDIKNGPGGLRDVQTVLWTAQALYECGRDDVWDLLAENRVCPREAAITLNECLDVLTWIRNGLHIAAGKPLDTLTVERQSEVARLLGFSSPKELMQRYYGAAATIRTECSAILSALAAGRLKIDKVFCVIDGRLALAEKSAALMRPGAITRAFRLARQYRVGISERLAREIRRASNGLVPDPRDFVELKEILAGPDAYGPLSRMAELGVLQKLLPQIGQLMHAMPEEKVHEYTIGQHLLFVVKRLDEMRAGEDSLYAGLCRMVHDWSELILAALLHDIGKLTASSQSTVSEGGSRLSPAGRDTGAQQAGQIATQIGFSKHGARIVGFLVANHELMTATARRSDVISDAVVKEFADSVGDLDMLRMLFLLNVADVMSVGQASWSEMQRRFLEDLYFAAEAKLSRPQPSSEEGKRYARRLKRELKLSNLPEEVVHEHLDSMPPSYLMNLPPERIAAHIEHVMSVQASNDRDGGGGAVVELRDQPGSRVTELTVCALDTGPGMLAQIAGALFAMDISVHSASVFTRRSSGGPGPSVGKAGHEGAGYDIAIDTLWIDHLGDRLPYAKRKEVERELSRILAGQVGVSDLLTARGKREPDLPTCHSVQLLRHHDSHSVVEIRAVDQEGLLYFISRTMSSLGWNILSARVTTIGREAVDSFEATGPRGCLSSGDIMRLRAALGSSSPR